MRWRLPKGTLWAGIASLVATGCASEPPRSAPMSSADAGPESTVEVPLPEREGGCEVGTRRPCPCDLATGEEVCVGSGQWSGCGCGDPEATVYVPPVPPVPPVLPTCGTGDDAISCEPYLDEPTEYSAQHCCTRDGSCGSTNVLLVGFSCVPRDGAPIDLGGGCPEEAIPFVDLLGCCTPEGMCGLTIDETMPNWDLGCVERTTMKQILDRGIGRRVAAALFGFETVIPDWQPMACDTSLPER